LLAAATAAQLLSQLAVVRVLHIKGNGMQMLPHALIDNSGDLFQDAVHVFIHSLQRSCLGALGVLAELRRQDVLDKRS
jgi:hypothetical protein